MASNIKSKPTSKESPTEPFKRAVAGCVRALARKPDLEIAFAAERPGLMGGKVRLPEPPRKLGKAEAAVVRGHADSIALRLACHDAALHRRLRPASRPGPCSRRWSRRVWKRLVHDAWTVLHKTLLRCLTNAFIGASSIR